MTVVFERRSGVLCLLCNPVRAAGVGDKDGCVRDVTRFYPIKAKRAKASGLQRMSPLSLYHFGLTPVSLILFLCMRHLSLLISVAYIEFRLLTVFLPEVRLQM